MSMILPVSAFCMCSSFAVHFLHKSAMTARIRPRTVIDKKSILNKGSNCSSSVPLYFYYNVRSSFVKVTELELFCSMYVTVNPRLPPHEIIEAAGSFGTSRNDPAQFREGWQ